MDTPPSEADSSSACKAAACPCESFAGQFYRPALCTGCYHDIQQHFPGHWRKVVEDRSVFFVHQDTGQKLFARPADASDALRTHAGVDAASDRGRPGGASGAVSAQVSAWGDFRPTGAIDRGAPSSAVDALRARTTAVEGGSTGASVPRASTRASTRAVMVPSTVQATAENIPEAPAAVPASTFDNLSIDLAVLSLQLSVASPPPTTTQSYAPTLIPVVTASPEVLVALESTEPAAEPPVPTSEPLPPLIPKPPPRRRPVSPAPAVASVVGAAEPPASVEVAAAAPQPATPALSPPPAPPPSLPPSVDTFAAPATAAPATATAGPLAAHLGPVLGDPLLVDLRDLLALGAAAGVAVFPVRQPREEDFVVARHIVLTPFTICSVAPHPTRLGLGVLQWERSLLSLSRLTSQPLFRVDQQSSRSFSGISRSGLPATAAASGNNTGGSGGIMSFLRRRLGSKAAVPAAAASAPAAASPETAAALAALSAAAAAAPSALPQRLSVVPPRGRSLVELEGGSLRPDAVGLLASFAPETPDTAAVLRIFRAGARASARAGFLLKRKRATWRERAPLGPLAWKRRFFALHPTHIAYYADAPGGGGAAPGALKGIVPLTGWVEVARVGAGGSGGDEAEAAMLASLAGAGSGGGADVTSRPHCFTVRTSASHHVFQAPTAADCDAWVRAIALNAQQVGMAAHDPHCVILPDAADVQRLASGIVARRNALLAAMAEGPARTAAAGAFEVDLAVHLDEAEQLRRALEASAAGDEGGGGDDCDGRWEQDEEGGYAGEDEDWDPEAEGEGEVEGSGMLSYADAVAIYEASGGGASEAEEEVLAQCSPPVRARLLRHFQGGGGDSPPRRRAPASGLRPSFTPVEVSGGGEEGERAFLASHAPVGAAPRRGTEVGVVAPDGQTLVVAAGEGGGAEGEEGQWVYIDDGDALQGPYTDAIMRAWLWAGYLRPDILVRFAAPVPGLGVEDGADADGVPQVYMPLAELFADPARAFVATAAGDADARGSSWLPAYRAGARFQALYVAACRLGVDRADALRQVHAMRAAELPADLSLLLDLCGVRDLHALQQAPLDSRGASGGAVVAPLPAAGASAQPTARGSS